MTHSASTLHAGIAAARNNEKQLARDLLRRCVGEDSGSEPAWLWLASVEDSADERLKCLDEVLRINPDNERAQQWLTPARAACAHESLTRGVTAAKSGEAEAARIALQRAVELDPEKELAWLWLASLSVSHAEKITHFERVLAINPANGHALTGIKHARTQLAHSLMQHGVAAVRSGARDVARTRLLEAVSHDDGIEDAWLLLAHVTDDATEKTSSLRRALAINPTSTRARTALDALSVRLAQHKSAWECPLCRHTAEASQNPCKGCGAHLSFDDINSLLSGHLSADENLRRTIAKLRDAFESGDATARDCRNLGLALLNAGEGDEAIEYLRAALRLDPQDDALARAIKEIVALRDPLDWGDAPQTELPSVAMPDLFETVERAPLEVEHEHVQPTSHIAADAFSGHTIMVVDDSPTIRKLVTIKLEKQGHRVIPAVDGMEALSMLNESAPDLILLDITMPRLDGYQLCKLIRSNPATKDIPVVMLSGKDGFFDKMRGKMVGSTAYITKPFEPETLLKVVAEHCGASASLG